MTAALGRPALAAITLHERGGGIAAVSRLLRSVLDDHVPGGARLHTLIDRPRAAGFATGAAARMTFGLGLAADEVTGRCDWVLFSHLGLAHVQAHVPRACRKPYAVFLHDVEAWSPLNGTRLDVLRGAALRLANSRFTAARVMAANPEAGPVIACPLALPPDWNLPASAPPPATRVGPHAVIIVGRMVSSERYKGHDQLIDAWPAVRAAVPDAQLICVGDGDDVPRLREKAAGRGLQEAVSFTGFVPDQERRSLYAHAKVLAMPSRREGFGLVYLEAMASGLPCVASHHDAASEVVVDGETGFLVEQDDSSSLAGRLISCLTDESRRREMGEAGRRRFLSHFTYEAFSTRMVGIIVDADLAGVRVGARVIRQGGA